MGESCFRGRTIDDLMRMAIEELLSSGKEIESGKGKSIELMGVMLELENPRARLSRTEMRGKPFSCLGELLWYLARDNSLSFIEYYLPRYHEYADGNEIWGGYGPRLFNWDGLNQFDNVTARLRDKPSSRKAVIQLFDGKDLLVHHRDVPCTCTFQFFVRDGLLHMVTHMRSNDIYTGFTHDIFCFTMLQEIMARSLGFEVGTYKHFVGSLHLYTDNIDAARFFLDEGWQSTLRVMPDMPPGDPWPSIHHLLIAEEAVRLNGAKAAKMPPGLDGYWGDLIRILQLFRCFKDKESESAQETVQEVAREIQAGMDSSIYRPFIDKKVEQICSAEKI